MIPQETESTHRRGFFERLTGRAESISLVQGQVKDINDRKAFFRSPEGEGLRWAADIIDTLAKQYGFRARAAIRGQGFFELDEDCAVIDALNYSITLRPAYLRAEKSTHSKRLVRLYGDLLVTMEKLEWYHLEGVTFSHPPPPMAEGFIDQAIETIQGKLIETGILRPVQI